MKHKEDCQIVIVGTYSILAFLMFLAIFNMPIGFYKVLKVINTIGTIIVSCALKSFKEDLKNYKLIFILNVISMILWNFIKPFIFDKGEWRVFNICAIVFYIYVVRKMILIDIDY